MPRLAHIFLLSVFVPFGCLAECAAPPVRSAQQAICYAVAYGNKNGIADAGSLSKRATKGAKVWTVRFLKKRSAEGHRGGWEVDVDAASGTVVRFSARK